MKHLYKLIFFSLFTLFAQEITPDRWNLEDWSREIYTLELELLNTSEEKQEVIFLPDSKELTVNPSRLEILPGEGASVHLELDLREQQEEFNFSLILRFSGGKTTFYSVTSLSEEEPQNEDLSRADRVMDYFYSPTCQDCLDFLEKEIPRLEEELGLTIAIRKWNLFNDEGLEKLEEVSRGKTPKKVPVLHWNGIILAGFESIERDFVPMVRGELEPEKSSSAGGVAFLPVLAAGLLDGVNPCAFSTLIFLLSYLSLRKRKKSLLLLTGLSFTLSVGATYFMVGLGLFQGLRTASGFQNVTLIISWIFTAFLVVLAVLSFRDFIRVIQGRQKEMTLQLPEGIKKRMRALIRQEDRKGFGILSGLVLGFFISLYELGCTGQIYLPTLVYMVENGEGGLGLLALYNIAFVVPLALVFLMAYRGVSSLRIQQWFQDHLALSKGLTALFFTAMAVLLLLF